MTVAAMPFDGVVAQPENDDRSASADRGGSNYKLPIASSSKKGD